MSQENGGNQDSEDVDTSALAPRVTVRNVPFLRCLGGEVWASVNPADKAQRTRVINAIQQDHELVSDNIGETLFVVHVVVHPAQSTFEGAQEGDMYPRIILRMKDGSMLCTSAKGVMQSLFMMVMEHGVPPWKDGVEVIVRQKSGKKQHRWIYLELVPKEQETTPDEIPI